MTPNPESSAAAGAGPETRPKSSSRGRALKEQQQAEGTDVPVEFQERVKGAESWSQLAVLQQEDPDMFVKTAWLIKKDFEWNRERRK